MCRDALRRRDHLARDVGLGHDVFGGFACRQYDLKDCIHIRPDNRSEASVLHCTGNIGHGQVEVDRLPGTELDEGDLRGAQHELDRLRVHLDIVG